MSRVPASGVVVTGGASGIGLATVRRLLRSGTPVAMLDLPQALAAAEVAASGCIAVPCDVRDADELAVAFATAADYLPSIDGVVCSAGIDRGGAAHELDRAVWSSVLGTNLDGTFFTCQQALKSFLATGTAGSIVCLSSPFAVVAPPGEAAAYAASKGGIASLVRALAVEYAKRGIRVNAVAPGPTETKLMWAAVPEDDIPEMRAAISAEVPAGRLGEAAEAAAVITWLLGPDAGFITGAHIPCDGGVLAKSAITR